MTLLEAPDEDAALERLHQERCTDGLPVIVPTEARVAAMLDADGHDGDAVVGVVPPRMGRATVRDVAVNAVMAGCAPAHLGVVCAAVRAVCDPRFALGIVQATTHNAAVLLVVNGPVRLRPPAFASGSGALGVGHRANVSVGRALRLVLLNAGGGHPGDGDMSTLGQPAKLTCCLAEAEEASPFPPLVDGSAVSALAAEGPHQVMFVPIGDDPARDADRLLELLARTVIPPGSMAGMGYTGSAALLLSPLHAGVLAAAGLDRAAVQREVHDRAALDPTAVVALHGRVRGAADGRTTVAALASPGHLLVAVAGGAGTYSSVLPGLAAGVGELVTVEVGEPPGPRPG